MLTRYVFKTTSALNRSINQAIQYPWQHWTFYNTHGTRIWPDCATIEQIREKLTAVHASVGIESLCAVITHRVHWRSVGTLSETSMLSAVAELSTSPRLYRGTLPIKQLRPACLAWGLDIAPRNRHCPPQENTSQFHTLYHYNMNWVVMDLSLLHIK